MKPDRLQARLQHVRWIGGGSGAGKSTIAGLLAADHGLRLYNCDPMQSEHTARSNPSDHPLLHAFLAMSMDERWVNRPPPEMLRTWPAFHGEGFGLIVEDLLALPTEPPILVEGYKLLPRAVSPLLSGPNQGVWLIPTPEFRRVAFDHRGSVWEIPRKTSDPERALTNYLLRDELFTREVAEQAAALELTIIEVDGTQTINEVATRVAEYFGLSPS